jgi:hypothetical protein
MYLTCIQSVEAINISKYNITFYMKNTNKKYKNQSKFTLHAQGVLNIFIIYGSIIYFYLVGFEPVNGDVFEIAYNFTCPDSPIVDYNNPVNGIPVYCSCIQPFPNSAYGFCPLINDSPAAGWKHG